MAYTTIDDPSAHFQAFLYTGNGSNRTITLPGNSDLKFDMYWYKQRSQTGHHRMFDTSRGLSLELYPDLTGGDSAATYFNNQQANSFDIIANDSATNTGDVTFANWQWKANGGTTANMTGGNINSVVQANTLAGFSIVTYTGNDATGQAVNHGLGATPEMVWVKRRDGTSDWYVYHQVLGNTKHIHLNTQANAATTSDFGNYGPDTNSFYVNNTGTCINNQTYVAYCFAPIQGFSKIGSYEGTGNADGPFIATAFKPAFVMVKNIDNGGYDWAIMDSARTPTNANGTYEWLWPNNNGAEFTDGDSGINMEIDFLSNGFKIRTARGELNLASTFIYMAFAENPFVTSTGKPTTAR